MDARLSGRNIKRELTILSLHLAVYMCLYSRLICNLFCLSGSNKRSHHAHGNQTDIIRSPGFPDSAYLPNLYTEWQIRADPEHRIRLEFDVLDLEKDCRNDFIKVYDSLAPSEKHVITE